MLMNIKYTVNSEILFSRIAFKRHTVKPVLSGHSKQDKTIVLMANGS